MKTELTSCRVPQSKSSTHIYKYKETNKPSVQQVLDQTFVSPTLKFIFLDLDPENSKILVLKIKPKSSFKKTLV